MKLSELKQELKNLDFLRFKLPSGDSIPDHFHVTEFGISNKVYIDCGGKLRTENYLTFQIWVADDIDHRLSPKKFLKIIGSLDHLYGKSYDDNEIEVEYQTDTIGRYGLEFNGDFTLTNKQTDCLAKDKCGLQIAVQESSSCDGETGCC